MLSSPSVYPSRETSILDRLSDGSPNPIPNDSLPKSATNEAPPPLSRDSRTDLERRSFVVRPLGHRPVQLILWGWTQMIVRIHLDASVSREMRFEDDKSTRERYRYPLSTRRYGFPLDSDSWSLRQLRPVDSVDVEVG